MEKYSTIIRKADDIPIVEEIPVEIKGKKSGYYAILEKGTNDTLGIHTQHYNLVQNRDIYSIVEGLKDFDILDTRLYLHGKVMMMEVAKKGEKDIAPTGDKNDLFSPRTRIFNSYNGSYSVNIQAFALRLVCKNGMVAPVKQNIYRKIHLGNEINKKDLVDAINSTKDIWNASRERIVQSTKFVIEPQVALFHLDRFPKKYRDLALKNLEKKDTLYNIWNELTRIVTHVMNTRVNQNVQVSQQQRVNKIFDLLNMNEKQMAKLKKELEEFNLKEVKQ